MLAFFFKSEALEVLIIIESLWCPGGIYCSGLFLGTVGPTNTHKKLAYELMDWDRADNVLFTSRYRLGGLFRANYVREND